MKRLRDWAARRSHAWLERFRQRRGLAAQAPAARGLSAAAVTNGRRVLLHVGCGHDTIEQIATDGFRRTGWKWHEIRLDANERVAPDIVGTMTDMSAVPDAFAAAIYSSHGIEHLFWHDVPRALIEFLRVLAEDGFAVITCPDLQAVAQLIVEDRIFETAYVSAAGPITPFDVVFGYRPFVEAIPEWMPHRCGFTLATLTQAARQAGFKAIYGIRRPNKFDLWVLASKSHRTEDEITALAAEYLPISD